MIKPGQTEKLAVTFNCHKLRNSFTREIRVSTNDPNHPMEKLACKGRMLDAYKLTPKNANFGMVSRKTPPKPKKIMITSADGGKLDLKLQPYESKDIQAELTEISPGERYELSVAINPLFESERLKAKLTLDTGIKEVPTATISVIASIAPRVRTTPRRFIVPGSRREGWEQSLRLIWDDDAPHQILGAEVDDPGLTVEVREKDGEQQVVLGVSPDQKPGLGTPTVKIKTDDSEAPEIKVRVTVGRKPTSFETRRVKRAGSLGRESRPKKSYPDKKRPKSSRTKRIDP